jgi:hypothetical protein
MTLRAAIPELEQALEHAWTLFVSTGQKCRCDGPAARDFIAERIQHRTQEGETDPYLLGTAAAADCLIKYALVARRRAGE